MNGSESPSLHLARQSLVAAAVVAGVVAFALFVGFAADLLLVIFAALLFSILLRGLSRGLRKYTRMGPALSLLVVSLALIVFTIAAVWLVVAQVGTQIGELQRQLPQALDHLKTQIEHYGWARDTLNKLPSPSEWIVRGGGNLIGRFTGLASTTFSAIVNGVLVIALGIYFAAQPRLYSQGVKRLIPVRHRARAGEVMDVIDDSLWRWLIGRFGLMILNGVFTSVGHWLLGVPFFLTLGLLAGLLNSIPNLGPWIAAIPAVLVGLLQSPWQALNVALLYLVLQSVDGYVFTPLVDRRTVRLPPVVSITAQLLLGAAFGFLGILLASPLATTAMISVKMLYVEGVLEGKTGH